MRPSTLTALLLLCPALSLAGGAGTGSADFLKIGLGARAEAMGGAFAAIADDASAVYWNPAGLSQLMQQEAGFLHTQWLDGISYEYFTYAAPHQEFGTLAGSFALLQKDSIPSYDETGASLGQTAVRNSALTLGWGRSLLAQSLALGLGLKWIHEDLAGYQANSYAADLGALYTAYQDRRVKLTAGLAIRHLGSHGAFISERGELPRTLVLGFGLKTGDEKLAAGLDVIQAQNQSAPYPALGVEYWLHPMWAVRAGYNAGLDGGSGFSSGIGFRVKSFEFDYAVADRGLLGLTHRGGVTFRFAGKTEALYQEALGLMQQGYYAQAFFKFNKLLNLNPEDKRVVLRMKQCQQHIEEELGKLRLNPKP